MKIGWGNGKEGERVILLAARILAIASVSCILFVDRPFMLWLNKVDCLFFDCLGFFSFFGDSALWLPTTLLLSAALHTFARFAAAPRREQLRHWARLAFFLFVAIAIAGLVNDLLKIVIGRARPALLFQQGIYGCSFFQLNARMWSFPSGHANTIFAAATAVFLFSPLRAGITFYAFAAIIAFGRILNGSHFPSDVLGGIAIAMVTTTAVYAFFNRQWAPLIGADPGGAGRFNSPSATRSPAAGDKGSCKPGPGRTGRI